MIEVVNAVELRRWVMWGRWAVVLPLAVSALFLSLASIVPVRFDYRNFHDLRRTEGLNLPRGRPCVFGSEDAGSEARRFAVYVIHHLAFPSSEKVWLLPKEAASGPIWAVAVESTGQISQVTPSGTHPGGIGIGQLRSLVERGVVVYDSEPARRILEARLPFLRSASIVRVLSPSATQPLALRPPTNAFSLTRWLRVASLVSLPLSLLPIFPLGRDRRSRMLAACLAVLCAPAGWLWTLSWSQLLPVDSPGPWPYIVWAAAATTLMWSLRQKGAEGRVDPGNEPSPAIGAAVAILAAVYFALVVMKLDFDEDTHAHWLFSARSYYLSGRHAPERLLGHVHAATYPFGFPEVLALAAWVADSPPEGFFGINKPTEVAVLAYRVAAASVQLALLGLVAIHVSLWSERTAAWGAAALVFVLFPIAQGVHTAAETLLFPLMAGAIVMLAVATRLRAAWLFGLGLFVGGTATLVKLEGGLLLAFAVLPWALAGSLSQWAPAKARSILLALLLASVLPTVLWKAGLRIPNPIYLNPLDHFREVSGTDLASVYVRCTVVLLKGSAGVLLLGALPAAAYLRWRASQGRSRWTGLIVPASIAAALLGLPAIYLFSTLPRLWQIDVSFGRLMLLPTFSALLYCVESVCSLSPSNDPP